MEGDSKKADLADQMRSMLTTGSKKVMKDFIDVMKIVQKFRLKLSSDDYPTMGMFAQVKCLLLSKVEEQSKNQELSHCVREFCKALYTALNERLKVEMWHVVAAILNPTLGSANLKGMLKIVEMNNRTTKSGIKNTDLFEEGCKMIRTLCDKLAVHETSSSTNSSQDEYTMLFAGVVPSSQDVDELTHYLLAQKLHPENHSGVMEWFKQHKLLFPRIYTIACCFMAPATSVSVERLFSLAGLKIGKNSYRLLPKNLEGRLLYFCNSHLLPDTEYDANVVLVDDVLDEDDGDEEWESDHEQEAAHDPNTRVEVVID